MILLLLILLKTACLYYIIIRLIFCLVTGQNCKSACLPKSKRIFCGYSQQIFDGFVCFFCKKIDKHAKKRGKVLFSTDRSGSAAHGRAGVSFLACLQEKKGEWARSYGVMSSVAEFSAAERYGFAAHSAAKVMSRAHQSGVRGVLVTFYVFLMGKTGGAGRRRRRPLHRTAGWGTNGADIMQKTPAEAGAFCKRRVRRFASLFSFSKTTVLPPFNLSSFR